jgi:hypothetical protein
MSANVVEVTVTTYDLKIDLENKIVLRLTEFEYETAGITDVFNIGDLNTYPIIGKILSEVCLEIDINYDKFSCNFQSGNSIKVPRTNMSEQVLVYWPSQYYSTFDHEKGVEVMSRFPDDFF